MAFSTDGIPNVNALWAGLLVDELCRQGVGLFVVAPGSRSTPLAVAVARAVAEGKTTWLVHPDERACAFVALGWARATGRPAAVVTTSGTAVANLLPAAVEADAAGVPLLLLTADRPPELRETGANQTIRQPGLFQTVARWAFDAPVPSARLDPAVILTTAAHAYSRTLAPAGPVHLNLPFREPLGAEPDGTDAAALLAPLARWTGTDDPYTRTTVLADVGRDVAAEGLARRLSRIERGLVVLGPTDDPEVAATAAEVAERLGWPLLPDVASQARLGATGGAAAHYDLALASAAFAEAHAPEAVLLLGGRPVSKRLLALIDGARPDPYIVVRAGPERFDPSHVVTERVVADLGAFCSELRDELWRDELPDSGWIVDWQRASEAAEAAAVAEIGRDLNEPFVARTVARLAPALVIAASMPIRDVDMFAASDWFQRFVTANRGASGIDGTVATAHGVARGLGEPVVLLIGDLALLHDQTSLMLLRDGPQAGPPVVVVVVNNDGGGIFHFLPVARGASPLPADVFEVAMAAPHGLRFRHAAAQFGLATHAPTTADDFEVALAEVLAEAAASGASALVEVTTDRAANEALHARITRAAAVAVEAQL